MNSNEESLNHSDIFKSAEIEKKFWSGIGAGLDILKESDRKRAQKEKSESPRELACYEIVFGLIAIPIFLYAFIASCYIYEIVMKC